MSKGVQFIRLGRKLINPTLYSVKEVEVTSHKTLFSRKPYFRAHWDLVNKKTDSTYTVYHCLLNSKFHEGAENEVKQTIAKFQ